MIKTLKQKKLMVINELINTLGYSNKTDLEASLNASEVLMDLVANEKTLDIFMEEDAKLVGEIMELAVDPMNSHNQ
jgi:hypothetical protein